MSTKRSGRVNVKPEPTIITDTTNVVKSEPIAEEIIRTDVPLIEFQKDYQLDGGDFSKQTEIDTLPEDIIIPSTTIDSDVETSIETLLEVKNESENIGLEHLKSIREETTKRWEESGLLEGLEGNVKENITELFENQKYFLIDNDDEPKVEKLEFDEHMMINFNEPKPINLVPVEDALLQPEIAVVPVKTKRSIDSLSASELRFYQRTGILPE